MHKEIESLVSEQNQLELEIGQREDQVKSKTSEASTLQVRDARPRPCQVGLLLGHGVELVTGSCSRHGHS